jgi:two-component system, OmpR family, alkaline phosphatase synthesis response regulator PhoP
MSTSCCSPRRGRSSTGSAASEVGADLYMTKPFDPDALLDKAREVLGI